MKFDLSSAHDVFALRPIAVDLLFYKFYFFSRLVNKCRSPHMQMTPSLLKNEYLANLYAHDIWISLLRSCGFRWKDNTW